MNSNSFPRNTTVQLSNDQARFAIELRKSFPLFAKNAKGGERGGLFIYLDEQNNSIKIGATKQSFINVVIHSIGQWYKNNAITKPKNNTQPLQDKPKETNTNTFDVLKEKEPDTHITLFGCRVPVDQKKGIKWHIGQSSFQDEKEKEKETDTDTHNDLPRINKVLSFSKVKKDFPSLGKPLESNHKWNGSQKVLQGNGLINPPKPDGWFGLNDINSYNQRMALQYRQDKVNAQIIHRRQQAEATDELGNIVDLEEYLRIQHNDLHDDDLNDNDLNDHDLIQYDHYQHHQHHQHQDIDTLSQHSWDSWQDL